MADTLSELVQRHGDTTLLAQLGQTTPVRYLTIVRHAKAAPAASGQDDLDRPLTSKGRAQAAALRAWVLDPEELGGYGPTTALVSASARTRETYAVAFAGTPFVHAVEINSAIYNGRRDVSADDLRAELAAVDPGNESLMVVGHNPTVFELAATLARHEIPTLAKGKYPLGAALVFAIDDGPLGSGPYEWVRSFVPEV